MAHYKGAASEGSRAMQLMKKREIAAQEVEFRKKKIEEELKRNLQIENKFASHYDAVEHQLKTSTIGLVTLDEMKAKQEVIIREREQKLALKKEEKNRERNRILEEKQAKKHKQQQQIATLSFSLDEDETERDDDNDSNATTSTKMVNDRGNSSSGSSWRDLEPTKKKKLKKDPTVDTSFLPDREREEMENKLREELRQEWVKKQATLKDEEINITFSFWDGSGHRKSLTMKKGHSIYQFLQKCLEILRPEFTELKTVTADQLMYVKEDLILPQHYTFYDFIVTKARGKSGPLFQFDVHDDVRIVSDASVEKEESHAGKVLLRSWYERNKHIFPASRWEPFDPTKTYSNYSIKDKSKNSV